MPKICVPAAGETLEEILASAQSITGVPADMAEWRADLYGSIAEPGQPEAVLAAIRAVIGDMPIVFTLRTSGEGGAFSGDKTEYVRICTDAIRSGRADVIDVELSAGDDAVAGLIREAHAYGVRVIASYHDFDRTPDKEEITARLRRMQDLGADILKIAVMPESKSDVAVLLGAAAEAYEWAKQPLVLISMGADGAVSRFACEAFGSAMTFGSASVSSAPGQIDAAKLRSLMESIHAVCWQVGHI